MGASTHFIVYFPTDKPLPGVKTSKTLYEGFGLGQTMNTAIHPPATPVDNSTILADLTDQTKVGPLAVYKKHASALLFV